MAAFCWRYFLNRGFKISTAASGYFTISLQAHSFVHAEGLTARLALAVAAALRNARLLMGSSLLSVFWICPRLFRVRDVAPPVHVLGWPLARISRKQG